MNTSFEFTDIIARSPGQSVTDGLRDGSGADPDPSRFGHQHRAYLSLMEELDVQVHLLPALEGYPDSVFIEDAALVVGDTAILLHPGAPSRVGEVAELRPTLETLFDRVLKLTDIDAAARVDGGDVLVTEQEVFAGESARTNQRGLQALATLSGKLGYSFRAVSTPPSILHFKTACGLLDQDTIFATATLAATGCFSGYRVIEAATREEAAANLIRVNTAVLVAEGYPETCETLAQSGYLVRTLDIGEAALIDGGLSCMSLRYNRHYKPGR